ncbi:TetR/AcrR family transcriptional regulator [Streptomyces sp. TS71-3]|uniref:TetR/AcrR family transcriptional regulator n=1 Tax=Streptomyces sp. TS71-3 TaxID=2733862 RepID=UPI001B1DC70E|nr:TetR/AcrR family transcriptional regulator [Streptomyces sp. TS71-3]GHJ36221.1 TetR family transcriptional regulator [Streptomyces sp. TS71-3]
MGHREDLLEGAKRCLLAKGFVRTTARDVVKESGTNLASIGYHYGSKDALLARAYISLIEGLGDGFSGPGPASSKAPPGSLERFRESWANILRSFPDSRAIWMLTFEFILHGEQLAEVRRLLIEAQGEGRAGLVPLFSGVPEADLDKETVESEGRFYQTLLNGLMVQWLFDPDSATNADHLAEGLRRIAAGVTSGADAGTEGAGSGGA